MLPRQRLDRYRTDVDFAAAQASDFVGSYIKVMTVEMVHAGGTAQKAA